MGVRIGRVERKPLVKDIRTVGYIEYDETKIFTVNTKFNGWIEKLYVDFVGDSVRKGQPLFDIYSPELVTAQEEYLLAFKQWQDVGNNDLQYLRESARRLLAASRKRLEYWDVTDSQIGRLEASGMTSKTVTVYSPAKGVVTQKEAFEGHYVKAGEHQYTIADLSTVWVDVDIYEYELPWVRKGMTAEMEVAYLPGIRLKGKVLFIYPYLNTQTRTAKLRLQFINPDYRLKPGMYVDIHLKASLADSGLVVPQEAVLFSGVRRLVYIALGNGRFRPQEIKLGVEVNQNEYQVLSGLQEGERIVLSAQFMLDSESRLQEAIQKMLELRKREPGGH
jgi:Cu(I)/Ag(I) efflux system membrane fusion protein/cobalt-zinc-cadmium efflux system membrane fusion protein